MSKNESQFSLAQILVPTFAAITTSAVVGGIYYGVNSLRSINGDPMKVGPER